MKYLLLVVILLTGCNNDSIIGSKSEPEFVFNRIECSFTVYSMIDSVKGDTSVVTQFLYGVNGYFRNNYGAISKQIVSFNGFIDTIYDYTIDKKPDPINPPTGQKEYIVPNILGELDSVKVKAHIYGSFFSDEKLQDRISDFNRSDSSWVLIRKIYFIRHLTILKRN